MIEIGSSDAPVILGCSPHKTPYRLWAELSGLIERDTYESEVMSWGTRLQGEVLAAFAESEKLVIYKEQPTVFHATKPWLRATADGLLLEYEEVNDKDRLVAIEVKCVSGHPPIEPRVDWLVQTLHQRMALESQESIGRQYIVCFGALRMVSWEIPRHQAAMDRVVREEERFLERIAQNDPPPLKAEDASVLHLRWPWSKPETVTLDDEGLLTADLIYQQTTAEIETLTRQQDEAKAIIMAAMGPAESAVLGNRSTYTWKTAPRKGHTVQPSNPRTFKRRSWEDKA